MSTPTSSPQSLAAVAAATPSSRRRHIDALRAYAIVMVVLGHWLLMHVHRTADGLTGGNALPRLGNVHWITWIMQVMPLFFLVAGASNAISWTRHRERGGSAADWLLGRSGRVFAPLTALLVLMAVVAFAARQFFDVSDQLAWQAVHAVILPLWFFVVYFAVMLLTPVAYRLHQRFGPRVFAACLVGLVIGDVLRFTTGNEYASAGNYVFAWAGIHQVGFAWADGTLGLTVRRAWVLFVGSLATAAALVAFGPYPLSMVSVPGEHVGNAGPPSLALVALGVSQIAGAVLVSGPLERWLKRPRAWAVVVAINANVMTLFLWHMVAGFLAALALDAFGWLPTAFPGTGDWWLARLYWFPAAGLVMAIIVATVGALERRGLRARLTGATPATSNRSAATPLWLVVCAYLVATLGMLWQNSAGRGPHGPFVVPTGALAMVLVASAVLWILRRRAASKL
jgi:fucose 4-O-acetylase-like acetyltransferase